MFGLFLLICVLGVGGMLMVVMVRVAVRQWWNRREARLRAERYAVMVVEAKRAHAERMAKLAPAQQPATTNALSRGELTGVISRLEQSAALKRIATPVPIAPRRVPRGTASPPLDRVAPPSRDPLVAQSSPPPSAPATASVFARPVHAPSSASAPAVPVAPRPARATNPPPLPPAARIARPNATQPPPLPPLPQLRTAPGTRPPPPRRS